MINKGSNFENIIFTTITTLYKIYVKNISDHVPIKTKHYTENVSCNSYKKDSKHQCHTHFYTGIIFPSVKKANIFSFFSAPIETYKIRYENLLIRSSHIHLKDYLCNTYTITK